MKKMNKLIYGNYKAFQNGEKPKNENAFYLNGLDITFRNKDDKAFIDIDGGIGFDIIKWLEDEEQNTQENIKKKLREIDASEIIVNINSLGGVVNDGLVIHDYLQEHPAKVTTIIRGMTASAGTIVSQGGYRKMSSNARILIHKVLAGMCGWFNSNDLEIIMDDIDGLNDTVASLYATAGNKTAEKYKELMAEANGRGVWLSAQEALEWGLVDEVYEPSDSQSTMNVNADHFKSAGLPVPDDLKDGNEINIPVNLNLTVNGKKFDGDIDDLKKEFEQVNQVTIKENADKADKEVPEGMTLEQAREREIETIIED